MKVDVSIISYVDDLDDRAIRANLVFIFHLKMIWFVFLPVILLKPKWFSLACKKMRLLNLALFLKQLNAHKNVLKNTILITVNIYLNMMTCLISSESSYIIIVLMLLKAKIAFMNSF